MLILLKDFCKAIIFKMAWKLSGSYAGSSGHDITLKRFQTATEGLSTDQPLSTARRIIHMGKEGAESIASSRRI